jgi:hypothetical protein
MRSMLVQYGLVAVVLVVIAMMTMVVLLIRGCLWCWDLIIPINENQRYDDE